MKPPYLLTDEKLKAYAEEHIQYEFDMLIYSAAILKTLIYDKEKGPISLVISNGLLNTFAVHARNLIFFIYSSDCGKARSNDVVLEDYLASSVINERRPLISPILKNIITKANRQVAHLTYDRINYEKENKEWNFIEVAVQIADILAKVTPHIPTGRISEEFREKLSKPQLQIPAIYISIISAADGFPSGISFSL